MKRACKNRIPAHRHMKMPQFSHTSSGYGKGNYFHMKLVLYLLLLPAVANGQNDTAGAAYPKDYFRNPLDIPIFLAGNFGECRPGHFHSGIDIKTQGRENQPVHAAADGYISRIKMEKGGFGHALYITHPNGYTTLYAHLNKFVPEIQQYLRREQYRRKRWDVDINLSPDVFPITKGQQIAWSGNTGASTAPHLHFEIRNTKTEHPLNPELFGLPVVDNIPPVPMEIAFYNMARSIYEQSPILVTVKKNGERYSPVKSNDDNYPVVNDTVYADGMFAPVGIGIHVNDYMDGSENTITFLHASLYMDDSLQSEIRLDNIGYDESRYINAYTDYKTKQQQGKWIQCFFKLPGNHLDNIYPHLNASGGGININDREGNWARVHKIRIAITDDRGNTSTIAFYIKAAKKFATPINESAFNHKFKANQVNSFANEHISFTLDERQLYDDFDFQYDDTAVVGGISGHYNIHYPYVPLHHYFDLKLNPAKAIPSDLKNKVTIMYSDGKDIDGKDAILADNGWYKAKVRNFGTYWLDIDTLPPVIKPLQKSGSNLSKVKEIAFEVNDAITSVRSFSGYLDGKWICFECHSDKYFYEFDEHCPKGRHELVFKAEDENGNTATYSLSFTK